MNTRKVKALKASALEDIRKARGHVAIAAMVMPTDSICRELREIHARLCAVAERIEGKQAAGAGR